jgi:hypothetical protein
MIDVPGCCLPGIPRDTNSSDLEFVEARMTRSLVIKMVVWKSWDRSGYGEERICEYLAYNRCYIYHEGVISGPKCVKNAVYIATRARRKRRAAAIFGKIDYLVDRAIPQRSALAPVRNLSGEWSVCSSPSNLARCTGPSRVVRVGGSYVRRLEEPTTCLQIRSPEAFPGYLVQNTPASLREPKKRFADHQRHQRPENRLGVGRQRRLAPF